MRRRLTTPRKTAGLCLETLEDRTVLSTVVWTKGANGSFNDAAAWTDQSNQTHHVPTPGDDVVIQNYVVTATADYAVDSINDNAPFQILGSFNITAQGLPSSLNIPSLAVGGVLEVTGSQEVALFGSSDPSNPDLLGGTLDSEGVIRFEHGYFSVGPQFGFAGNGIFEMLGDAFGASYFTMDYPVTAPAHFVQNDGTIAGSANFTIPSGVTTIWNGGTMQDAGTTVVQSGATLVLGGTVNSGELLDRVLNNSGTIDYQQTGSDKFPGSNLLGIGSNSQLNNLAGANFNIQTDADIAGAPDLTGVINNAGTITKTGTAGMVTTLVDVPFNNSGQVNIQSGGVTVNGGGVLASPVGTDSGGFTVAAGAGLNFRNGTYTVNPGATFAGAGPVSINAVNGGSPDLIVNASVSIPNFVLGAGTLDGTGTLTIATTGSWIDGIMQGSGTTAVAAGATLTISGTDLNSRFVDRTLSVAGTVNHTGGDISVSLHNAGVITVQPNGTYNLASDGTIFNVGGLGTINNAGLFVKTSPIGTGTTIDYTAFNNTGTLRVDSGTLILDNGGTDTGAFSVTGSLTFGSGTSTINAGASFGGPGLVTLADLTNATSTLLLNTPVTIADFSETGGVLDGAATLTLSNIASWSVGTMQGGGTTLLSPGATMTLSSGPMSLNSRTLNVGGTVNHTGGGIQFYGTDVINIQSTGTYNLDADVTIGAFNGTINNQGVFSMTSPDNGNAYEYCPINNSGTLQVNGGNLFVFATETQTAGLTTVASGATLGASGYYVLQLNGGTLGGNGTINGNIASTGSGTVSPGSSPGLLTVNGNVNLGGPLLIELTGTAVGTQYDQLKVNGAVALSGPITLANSFSPAANTSFDIIDNDASDAISGTFASQSEGSTISSGGKTFQVTYRGGDGNDVYLTAVPAVPPSVAAVQVNNGAAQRSEVKSIAVTFSGHVNFAGGNANAAAAFQLQHVQTGNNVALSAIVSTNGTGQTVVTLTFSGGETDPVSGLNGGALSLADGRYQLTILAANATGTNGLSLAGGGANGNYVSPADTYQGSGLHLYRLFGDASGDGVVDAIDLGQFRSTFNANNSQANYLSYLDADSSGSVDAQDLGQFRTRFNANVF